jgi:hypothetical protein
MSPLENPAVCVASSSRSSTVFASASLVNDGKWHHVVLAATVVDHVGQHLRDPLVPD